MDFEKFLFESTIAWPRYSARTCYHGILTYSMRMHPARAVQKKSTPFCLMSHSKQPWRIHMHSSYIPYLAICSGLVQLGPVNIVNWGLVLLSPSASAVDLLETTLCCCRSLVCFTRSFSWWPSRGTGQHHCMRKKVGPSMWSNTDVNSYARTPPPPPPLEFQAGWNCGSLLLVSSGS